MVRGRSWMLAVGICASGCIDAASPVQIPEGSFPLAFVMLRADPQFISGPLSVSNGELVGDVPSTWIIDDSAELILVGLDEVTLRKFSPHVHRTALDSARLRPNPPPASCPDGRVLEADRASWLEIGLAEHAQLFDLSTGDRTEPLGRLRKLTLELPLQAQTCPELPRGARRFTALRGPLDAQSITIDGSVIRRGGEDWLTYFDIHDVLRLDEDTIVVSVWSHFYLLRRGQPLLDERFTHWVPSPTVGARRLSFGPFSQREVSPGTWQLVAVAYEAHELPTPDPSYLVELTVTSERFTSAPRIVFGLDSEGDQLNDVALDQSGRVVATSDLGRIATASSARGRYRVSQLGSTALRHVVSTNDPAHPHMFAGSRGAVILGDASRLRFDTVYEMRQSVPVDALYVFDGEDGPELFASSETFETVGRTPGASEFVAWPTLRPGHDINQGCGISSTPCNLRVPTGEPDSIAVIAGDRQDERLMFFSTSSCNQLFVASSLDGCTTAAGAPAEVTDSSASEIRRIHAGHGVVTMVGRKGLLMEIPLR